MLDRATATTLVTQHINADYHVPGDELVVLDEETLEKDYGWVFFYTSRQYLETGDFQYMLGGNGPLIVDRFDGSLTELGTALPTEDYIAQYEADKSAIE